MLPTEPRKAIKVMRLTGVEIRDYKGIGELDIEFDEHLTILVGENGVGKTRILEGIGKNVPEPGKHLAPLDRSLPAKFFFRDEFESGLKVNAKIEDPVKPEFDPVLNYRENRLHYVERGNQSISPKTPSHSTGEFELVEDLSGWWDERDAQEARKYRDSGGNFKDLELEAIRDLVKTLPGFLSIGFDPTRGNGKGLFFTKEGLGTIVYIDQLSTGERAYLTLLADIARRASTMCSTSVLQEAKLVILIDEIELHLHPKWQRQIIQVLRETFKSCQFIIATHSPAILSEVEAKHIRILAHERDKDGVPTGKINVSIPQTSKGNSIADIVEDVLGGDARPKETKENLEQLSALIKAKNFEAARALVETLDLDIEGEDPSLLIQKHRLARAEAIGVAAK